MKRIGIFLVLLLLLAIPLAGCDADSLMAQGSGYLDKILGGDPDTPRMSVETNSNSSQPQKGSYNPQTDPEPSSQEPSILPVGVEPTIPSPAATDPEPSSAEPPVTSDPPTASNPPSSSSGAITPSHTDATFFGPGESFRYLPKGVEGIYACTYASQNESIAKVDSDTGKVTAVGPGTTKVTMHLEYNGQYDFECIVRCNWTEDDKQASVPTGSTKPTETTKPANSPTSDTGTISASHSDATFFNPKEHFQLLPVGAGSGYTCTYTTDDAKVASVSEKGVVTAVGPGTTTVTMTVDGGGTDYIFKCIVRCKWTEESQ